MKMWWYLQDIRSWSQRCRPQGWAPGRARAAAVARTERAQRQAPPGLQARDTDWPQSTRAFGTAAESCPQSQRDSTEPNGHCMVCVCACVRVRACVHVCECACVHVWVWRGCAEGVPRVWECECLWVTRVWINIFVWWMCVCVCVK